MSGPGLTAQPPAGAVALQRLAAAARSLKVKSVEHVSWIHALSESGGRAQALAELEAVMRLPGGQPVDLDAMAFEAFRLGAHEIACELYAQIVRIHPADAAAWYNLASAERTLGRFDESASACDRALALDPSQFQAALLRSEVRKQTVQANHVDDLRRRLATTKDGRALVLLHYALGKELDDLGDYDAAFHAFATGAQHRRRALDYDVGRDLWKLARITEVFDAKRLAHAPPLQAIEHGFILGMPRSGTTLIERVLTGNEAVASNGETDNLLQALVEGAPQDEPDVFLRFAGADPARVGQSYARRARDARGRRLVLEKLPFNYLYVGAIRLTLPGARVVLLARSPADNCLAMYSTLFGSAYPFSYDLAELGRYYVGYRKLMAHWKASTGDQLLEVGYEDFVESPGTHGPRVAAHLGVEWSQAMLRIEDNPSASATASAAQVRRPIYRTAAGRWRRYAKHLAPLLAVLEVAGIDPDRA